jgi:hypothetical protein
MKLALKLMSSTSAQNALQADTYHIRANYVWYFEEMIQKSILSTTGFELPEFEELVRTYTDKRSSDYNTIHHAIHFMHHMFTAHVKIAFLIHMQVMHNIDMRSVDSIDKRMCNNCFFVNFEATHIPTELTLQNKLPPETRNWLKDQKMLHTRVQIKTNTDSKVEWTPAPVMDGSSDRSAMKQWSAKVARASLPRYPYEKQVCVPIMCAAIQRVDMKELVKIVTVAAREALKAYEEARTRKARLTRVNYADQLVSFNDITRRQFADRCFLTRKQQHEKTAWYNQSAFKLRQRADNRDHDKLEFNWGYERPEIERQFTRPINTNHADDSIWKHWDQLDVRMYYFNIEMKKKDEEWRAAASGVWYVQDYCDFFQMLKNLPAPAEMDDCELTLVCPELPPKAAGMLPKQTRQRDELELKHKQHQAILSLYAFQKNANLDNDKLKYHDYFVHEQDEENKMPEASAEEERAYHRFSVLSWFFDCRDAGACRWQWEEYVLNYFDATPDNASALDSFDFKTRKETGTEIAYFDDAWFVMTVFLEINFRNAVAAMHYKLWNKESMTANVTGPPNDIKHSLQNRAKELYHRQHSLLNTRALCPGLQGVSPGLSWKKNPERNCLRNLLLSSLDDTLPALDPFLVKYLEKFNAPNAALFLRTIEVSNVLALRELALQHKLASQTSPTSSKLEQRLCWFEPAVQSEIRYLMHSVERDDSVFTVAPIVHPTKAIVLEEELMRKWVRQTLGVHQHLHTLRCPLDVKFHIFTSPEMFRVLMQLFCTKTQLDNSHTHRPVVFVLLQIHLLAEILKGAMLTKNEPDSAVNKIQ